MVVVRCWVLVFACVACGRLGFKDPGGDGGTEIDDPADPDQLVHLHAADGWSIAPLVELTPYFDYNPADFVDTDTLSNEPSYVAALYSPFTASLAVIAGRSLIEIPEVGDPVERTYKPTSPDTSGPDRPARATFADLGGGVSGLWLSSSSSNGGDGLYLVSADWRITRINAVNNVYALGSDPGGGYGNVGTPLLYVGTEQTNIERQNQGSLVQAIAEPAAVDDIAMHGDSMFVTLEGTNQLVLDRLVVGQSPIELARSTSLVLAEGPIEQAMYGIKDAAQLVTISQTSGAFEKAAWSDEPHWAWRAVSAPHADNAYAGKLIVLEVNRALNRDRLLVVTPP